LSHEAAGDKELTSRPSLTSDPIEVALAPLDRMRVLALRWAMPLSSRLARAREARVAVIGVSVIVFATGTASGPCGSPPACRCWRSGSGPRSRSGCSARRERGRDLGEIRRSRSRSEPALPHPIVWFVMPKLIAGDWLTMVLAAELFAIIAEAAWLRAFGLDRALAWAAFANAASVLVGLISRQLFGWP
jgi:hypothetical protein